MLFNNFVILIVVTNNVKSSTYYKYIYYKNTIFLKLSHFYSLPVKIRNSLSIKHSEYICIPKKFDVIILNESDVSSNIWDEINKSYDKKECIKLNMPYYKQIASVSVFYPK